jgi:hypothetical protein
VIEERDESTPVGKLYLKLHDATEAMSEITKDDIDENDPEQVKIWKSNQVLLNKVIYADSFLEQ